MKKVLLFLMLIASVSVAWAQNSIKIDGITYTVSNNGENCKVTAADANIVTANIPSSVTIGNNEYDVTEIGERAFIEHTNLTSVSIPSTIETLENNPFGRCQNLETITVDAGNVYFKVVDGILYTADETELICCPARSGITSYTIPEGVTKLRFYAFDGCSNLTSVTLPESLVDAGDGTFRYCNLTSLVLPENVEKWGTDLIAENSNFEVLYIVNPQKTILEVKGGADPIEILDVLNFAYSNHSVLVLNEDLLSEATKTALKEQGVKDTDYISVASDYTLTVSDAGAATLYLPFAVTIPEDADYFVAATVSSISISGTTGYAHMKMIKKGIIPACTGVIIQANPGDYTLSMTTDGVTENIGTNILEGVFEETAMSTIEAEGNDVYVLRRGVTENLGFKKVGTGSSLTTLSPFKAYLPMAQNAGVKSVNLTFGGDPTGIEKLEQTGAQKKNTYYNLQGQRVENPTRGIYIINGKKILFQ